MPHQDTSYNGLEKPAVRMLNGFLTFYYGALNFSCYDGDRAAGGEAGGTEGLGTGSVRPLFRARRLGRSSSVLDGRST